MIHQIHQEIMLEDLIGQTVIEIKQVFEFSIIRNDQHYNASGFMTTYGNGMKTIASGWSSRGEEYNQLLVIDENDIVTAEYGD